MADNKIQFDFERRFNLGTPGAPTAGGLPTVPVLTTLHDQATSLMFNFKAGLLVPEQRELLAGKRSFQVCEALHQAVPILSKHPRITAETGVSPESCDRALSLDSAASKVIVATGEVVAAGSDALRLNSGDLRSSTDALTQRIWELQNGPQGSIIRTVFADSLVNNQIVDQIDTTKGARRGAVTKATKEQVAAASQRVEEARELATFLLTQKKGD